MRVHHGSIDNDLGFYFLGIRTRVGFLFIQVRASPSADGRARDDRLRRYSLVLRHALALAAHRARKRQVQLRREQILEQLAGLPANPQPSPPGPAKGATSGSKLKGAPD